MRQVYKQTDSVWHIKVGDTHFEVPVGKLKDFYIKQGLTPLPKDTVLEDQD